MSFSDQIKSLVGNTVTESELDQWMADGAKEIINLLPRELQIKCATRTSITDLSGTDLDGKGQILHVTRLSADSGGFEKACREIPAMYGDLTNDSSDLMYYATVTDPVYFQTNNASGNPTLFVRPNPTNAQPSYVHHIAYPTIDADVVSVIDNFPDEVEYLVVLYASIKALHNIMIEKNANLPNDISSIVLATITTSLPTYISPGGVVIPSIPSDADVSFTSLNTPEIFLKPVFNAPILGTISSMSLPSSPSSPIMNIKSVTITGTAPTYTQPTLSLSPLNISDLTISSSAPTAPDVDLVIPVLTGTAPTYTKPSITTVPSWPTFGSMALPPAPEVPAAPSFTYTDISVADIVAPLLNISDKVALSTSAPTYTKPTFSPPVFPTFSSLTMPTVPTAPVIPGIVADISSLTAPVFNQQAMALDFADANNWVNIEEDNEMLGARISVINAQVSEFNANINNELNKYNELKDKWDKDVEVITKNKELEDGKIQKDITKYQVEVSSYQQEVNATIQEWKEAEFSPKIQQYRLEYQNKVQQYQQDIVNELNEFNKENVAYQEDIGRKSENFQKEVQQATSNAQANLDKTKSNLNKDVQIATANAASNYQEDVDEYVNTLQRYGQNIGRYQAQVNTEANRWLNEEYTPKLQEYTVKYNSFLQEYAHDIQNELNEFNKESTLFQAQSQRDLKDAELAESEEGRKLQKYASQIQAYQFNINKEVETYQNNLQKELQIWQITRQTDLQKYQVDAQNSLHAFNKENAEYQAKLQKDIQDAQL